MVQPVRFADRIPNLNTIPISGDNVTFHRASYIQHYPAIAARMEQLQQAPGDDPELFTMPLSFFYNPGTIYSRPLGRAKVDIGTVVAGFSFKNLELVHIADAGAVMAHALNYYIRQVLAQHTLEPEDSVVVNIAHEELDEACGIFLNFHRSDVNLGQLVMDHIERITQSKQRDVSMAGRMRFEFFLIRRRDANEPGPSHEFPVPWPSSSASDHEDSETD